MSVVAEDELPRRQAARRVLFFDAVIAVVVEAGDPVEGATVADVLLDAPVAAPFLRKSNR